jgi:hypothetical protein
VRKGDHAIVVDQGKEGTPYGGIGSLEFSPDNKHVAYAARRDKDWFVVLDGQEIGPFEGISHGSIMFSPGGGRLAFVAVKDGRTAVVLDGVPQGWHSAVCMPAFSPDGSRFAYGAAVDGRWRVIAGPDTGPGCAAIVNDIVFSPDSRRLAYGAQLDSGFALVVDGLAGARLEDLGDDTTIVFSPDSRRVANFYRRNDTTGLMVDGEPAGIDPFVQLAPVFSPDSRRLAYLAKSGPLGGVVVDGVEDTFRVNGVVPHTLVFSPDSRHYAYACWRNADWFVVLDGRPSRVYSEAPVCGWRVRFLPGNELQYVARADDSILLVTEPVRPAK